MRKSLEKRLIESESLLLEYKESNLISDYRARFISDMILRLSSKKTLSKKQREWLDSLIDEGLPQIEFDKDLFEKIQCAIFDNGMQHRRDILTDFGCRIRSGLNLSEKQIAYLDILLSEHNEVKKNGPYNPTNKQIELLSQAIELSVGYSSTYWTTHPGTYKALQNVRKWMVSVDGDHIDYIDKYSVEKILKAMKSRLNELNNNPYVKPGSMVWYKSEGDILSGICTSKPSVFNGSIFYDILCGGKVIRVTKESIMKRRSTE